MKTQLDVLTTKISKQFKTTTDEIQKGRQTSGRIREEHSKEGGVG